MEIFYSVILSFQKLDFSKGGSTHTPSTGAATMHNWWVCKLHSAIVWVGGTENQRLIPRPGRWEALPLFTLSLCLPFS